MISTLVIFHFSNLDLEFQRLFYSQKTGWMIDKNDHFLKLIFYIIPKKIITIFCITVLLLSIYISCVQKSCSKMTKYNIYYMLASISFILIAVLILKQTTIMHCPDSITHFNGYKPFVKLFEKFPSDFLLQKLGKCFPAGHASGGFSLLCLGLVLKSAKHRKIMTIISLILGSLMGTYQILKGAHYLSDTITTLLLSVFASLFFYKIVICDRNQTNYRK